MQRPRALFALLLTAAVAGCAPLTLFHKEGVEVSRMQADETACRADALGRVPVNNRTRYIPPLYDTRRVCNASGQCHYFRQLIRPARWETFDANEGLRNEVAGQCMADKGYARVRIPQCDPATVEQTTITATRVLPPLTDASCAIRIQSGRWQIVTPGAK